jgi:hypothetical protein
VEKIGGLMDSILISVKKVLGITEEYEHFDQDIIIHINSTLATLTQLGVGPENGFAIADSSASWSDFTTDLIQQQLVKSYIYLKVKLLFDPPQSSAVLESMNKQIAEFEWRLNVRAEGLTEDAT